MKREEFTDLLKSPFNINESVINSVKEITEEFPYFQTARLLYAKLLKESQNIHFDNQLKIAAAYASDRKQLFNLIEKTEEVRKDSFVENVLSGVNQKETIKFEEPIIENKIDEPTLIINEPIIEEEIRPEIISEEKNFFPEKLSPEEMIRKRLDEIKQERIQQENIIEEVKEEKPSDDIIEIISQPEYQIENYLEPEIKEEVKQEPQIAREIKTEKKEILPPAIEEKEVEKEIPSLFSDHLKEKHSFLEWLTYGKQSIIEPEEKIKPAEEKNILLHEKLPEEKKDASEPFSPEEPKASIDLIIEKFIKEEPRISPAKAAFYSPVNMARKSVEEHDDLVSPTLAQIYLAQGNPKKSIETYEKLILLYPEKSAFFAAQIEKIKKSF
jgi:tetratricopeptide (TPR) repeat protein